MWDVESLRTGEGSGTGLRLADSCIFHEWDTWEGGKRRRGWREEKGIYRRRIAGLSLGSYILSWDLIQAPQGEEPQNYG